jgi:hypothetical protein
MSLAQRISNFFRQVWRWIDPPWPCEHCGFDYSEHLSMGDLCPDGSGRRFQHKKEGEV